MPSYPAKVTVEMLYTNWLESLHNAAATTLKDYRYSLAPLRERHGGLPAQQLTRPHLDRLLNDLRDGGTITAKGNIRKDGSRARSTNASSTGA